MKKQTCTVSMLAALLMASVSVSLLSCDAAGTDTRTIAADTSITVTDTTTVPVEPAENVINIPVIPSATSFEMPEAVFEAGGWEPYTVSLTLPDGWLWGPYDSLLPHGTIVDETGAARGEGRVLWFDTLDDDPPENVPPKGQEWQAIYASMRLSSFQSMYGYEAVRSGDRYENAVAMLEYIEVFEPGEKADAETVTVPIVLGYDRDASLYLQITWYDDTVEEALRREIAESITFAKQ